MGKSQFLMGQSQFLMKHCLFDPAISILGTEQTMFHVLEPQKKHRMGAAGHDFPRTSTNICCGGQLTGIRSFSEWETMKNPWENPHLRKRLPRLIHSFLSVLKTFRLLKCHLFLVKQQ